MTTVDWVLVGGYVVAVWLIGFWLSRRSTRSTEEFFASGRGLPWWLIGTSMAASAFSSDTPHYVARLSREHGIARNWEWWGFGIGGVLVAFVLAPLWRRVGVLTDLELIELRYGGRAAAALRGVRAVHVGLLLNVLAMAAPLAGMIVVLEALELPWLPVADDRVADMRIEVGGVLVAATVLYSFFGGFWGVVVTDFLQFVIAMVAAVVVAVAAVSKAGGLAAVVAAQPEGHTRMFDLGVPAEEPWSAGLMTFVVFACVQWWTYVNADGGGKLVQRMVAAKSERHALWGTLWFNVTHYALRTWPWVLVGLASVVLLPKVDPRLTYAATAVHVLPAGLLGLFVASFVAAYMSTVDTQLNWGASYLVNDLYRRFWIKGRSDGHYVAVARLTTLLLAAGAVAMLTLSKGVTDFLRLGIQFSMGYGIALLARWLWWRATAAAEIVALLAALGITILFKSEWPLTPYALKLLGTAVGTAAAWLLAVAVAPARRAEELADFYRRARPPGLWGPVAALCPDVTKPGFTGFGRGAAGVLLVFGATLGLGSALMGRWVPAGIWMALAVAGALGVAPRRR